jgi:hypothetical protein
MVVGVECTVLTVELEMSMLASHRLAGKALKLASTFGSWAPWELS